MGNHDQARPSRGHDWRRGVPPDMTGDLLEEIGVYSAKIDELLEREGDYVVISGVEVLGFYETFAQAATATAGRSAEGPVLIKQISRYERIIEMGAATCFGPFVLSDRGGGRGMPSGPEACPELVAYRANQPELLSRAEGRYALIKGSDVVDVYDTEEAADAAALRLFGREPVMIQRIAASEKAVSLGGAAIFHRTRNLTQMDELRVRLRAVPFQPFRIVTATGEKIEIRRPESVGLGGRTVAVVERDDRTHLLHVDQVVAIEDGEPLDFKEYLMTMPSLEGVDLTRDKSLAWDVDLGGGDPCGRA